MRRLREAAGLRQPEMAILMGLSLRGYQDLEAGRASFSPRHQIVLERVSLNLAIRTRNPELAAPIIREQSINLANLLGV